jgi:hypothetical protein
MVFVLIFIHLEYLFSGITNLSNETNLPVLLLGREEVIQVILVQCKDNVL